MSAFRPLADRLWEKVIKTPTCWIWTGAISSNGYGRIGVGSRTDAAHRMAYELARGPLPKDRRMTLDHLCRNRACVNPDHLELVTQRENILRGELGVLRTHCRQGHPYPEFERRAKKGTRFCIACRRASDRLRSKRS